MHFSNNDYFRLVTGNFILLFTAVKYFQVLFLLNTRFVM